MGDQCGALRLDRRLTSVPQSLPREMGIFAGKDTNRQANMFSPSFLVSGNKFERMRGST